MKVKQLQAIQCPECGELVHQLDLPKPTLAWQCSECEAIYDDRDLAESCCKE